MKRIATLLFIGMLFWVIQTTWLSVPIIQKVRPDLLLLLTLFLGLSSSPIAGGMLAFFFGYLTDLFSGNGFGLFVFSRPLLFFGTQLFQNRLYLESVFSRSLFVFLFALAEGVFLLLLFHLFYPNSLLSPGLLFSTAFIPQCLATALFSSPLFTFLKKGMIRLDPQPRPLSEGRGKS